MTRPKHPPITKARIYNCNYYYAPDGERLVLTFTEYPQDRPWVVYRDGSIRRFRTHVKAVKWATERVREGRK